MDEENLNSLVDAFNDAVERTFNNGPADLGPSFFKGISVEEIDFINYAGLERTPEGILAWRPRALHENLGMAEIYAKYAEKNGMQDVLKPSLPNELKSAQMAEALFDRKAPVFATLCCPIKI